jgi:hypothetical protein
LLEYREVVVRDGEKFCDPTATKVMMTFDEERSPTPMSTNS